MIALVALAWLAVQAPAKPVPPVLPAAPPTALPTALPTASTRVPPPVEARAPVVDARAFTWVVDPTPVVLGSTASAVVTLSARGTDGAPLDVGVPRVTTSVGVVSAPERTAAGTWTFTFTPPANETIPQFAIVIATLDGPSSWAVGFLPLALWAEGKTVVRTKPASEVTLRVPTLVGTKSFGPVRADENGRAPVPIVVPPGASRGIAHSRDEAGNESEAPIDLGLPPFNRLALAVVDDVVTGDGTGLGRVLAVAVDERGAPLAQLDSALQAKTSLGTVDITPIAPGLASLAVRPGKTRVDHADIEVTLAGAAVAIARASVGLAPGRVVAADVTLSRDVLTADDADRTVRATIRLVDDAGRPAGSHTVGVSVDVGRVSVLETADDEGARAVTWTVPDASRATKASLTVRLPSGEILGGAELELLRGKPAAMSWDPQVPVVADGETPLVLTLHASDRLSIPVAPTTATYEIDPAHGRVIETRVDGAVVRVRVLLAAADTRNTVLVRARAGDVTADTELRVLPKPRVTTLIATNLVVGSNYEELVSVGPDISFFTTLPLLQGTIVAGGAVSLLQSVVRPAGVADQRAIPAFAELAWRPPTVLEGVDLHFGVAGGVAVIDLVRAGATAHIVEPVMIGHATLGVVVRGGPGAFEASARVGSSLYFDDDSNVDDFGLPIGAGLVVGYRFALF